MKSKGRNMQLVLIILSAISVAGCSMPALKQDIPVSTNPRGAMIYANGVLVGATPSTVSLERNRSHILTLVKDNYRQEDIAIINRYQKEKVYLKAIQSGISSGLFFKSGAMGVGSSMRSFSSQEDSGEAYVLYPPAVTINLVPLGGSPSASALPSSGHAHRHEGQPLNDNLQSSPTEDDELAKEMLKTGAGAAAAQMHPIEKKMTTSSSSKSYVTSDGTRVHTESRSSVGVGFNPAGLINVLDTLFK